MTTLLRFLQVLLQVAPRLLWWALGGLAFGLANLALRHEVWPNTPAALSFFISWTLVCLLLLPWLAARMAWLLAETVESYFWKPVWRLAAIIGYGGAALLSLLALIGLLVAR
jgi:hypothetical protein